jgi:benzoate-CoA ligase
MINFAKKTIEQSKNYPNKIAYRDGIMDLTYGEIPDRVGRIANGFVNSGLKRGDHVIIHMDDSIDWPCTFLACLYANIIPLPLSVNLGQELLDQISEFIESKMFITDNVIAEFYKTQHSNFEPVMVHPDAPAWMNVSSGSTGMPKIAVHRHQTLFEMLRMSPWPSFGMTKDSVVLSTPKMSWNYGLHNSITYVMGLGATGILIRGVPVAPTLFDYMHRFQPDIVISSPSIIRRLLTPQAKKYTMPASVKHFNSSGEHLPAPMYDQFYERYNMPLNSCIGMMETATNYAANPDWQHDRGTVGQALDGCKIKLVNDEIYVSSPANACYYYKNYQKTKDTFLGEWVRTGDRGYFNEHGNLVFVGRVDDIFKVNDLIVNPLEIEAVIMTEPGVDQVAVTRVVNAKGVNEVHAFIVATDNFDLESFKTKLRTRLFPHQVPGQINLVDQLEETANNKKHRKRMAATV